MVRTVPKFIRKIGTTHSPGFTVTSIKDDKVKLVH